MSCCASQLRGGAAVGAAGASPRAEQLRAQGAASRVLPSRPSAFNTGGSVAPGFAHSFVSFLGKHVEIQLAGKHDSLFYAFSQGRFSSPASQASRAAVRFVGIAFSLLIEFSERCSFPNTRYKLVTFFPLFFFFLRRRGG